MFNAIKRIALTIGLVLLLSAGGIMAGHEAHAAPPPQPIPTIGKTADGKYPVYNLKGDLEDLNYASPGKVWQPDDLLKRMTFVDAADVKSAYARCELICKNRADQVIGLNPQIKWMAK